MMEKKNFTYDVYARMNIKQKSNALVWLVLSIIMIGLDQWTKHLAVTHLQYRVEVPFIDGFWNWTLAHNYGAAFSFLADAGGWQHWFFISLAFLICIVLTVFLAKMPRARWHEALPYALIIGGAVGNVIDRIRFGYVVDFIDWYYKTYHWPVFNIADSCIVVGAVLMLLFSFKKKDAKA
jgi:signal peptidase II